MAVVLFAVLFYFCLTLTGENSAGLLDERIYFKKDSVALNLVWICAALCCLYFVGKLSGIFQTAFSRNILCAVVCVSVTAIGIWWMHSTETTPQSDQMMVSYFADCFNSGDYSSLARGGYVALLPYQLGLITLLRVLYKIFGAGNYQSFQYLVIFSLSLLIISGSRIVRILSNDNVKAEIYYLLAMLLCFPMYAYTIFVYGDLISTVLVFFGMWMYLDCLKSFSWVKMIFFGLSVGAAVQLREVMKIFVVALVITGIIKLLSERKRCHFIMLASLAGGLILGQAAIWWIYRDIRPKDADSIPAALVVVMGLDDEGERSGWFNRYHYDTFESLDYDAELSKQKAYEDLEGYLSRYREDPAYMLDFFKRKMTAQWEAPMYQSIAMNSYVTGEQSPLIHDIFNHGRVAGVIEKEMKIYQLLLYGGILFWLIAKRKETVRIEKYTFLIAVFGGFWFSLIWEAKTRYILPYFIMMIPYLAMGISEITLLPGKWAKKYIKTKKQQQDG